MLVFLKENHSFTRQRTRLLCKRTRYDPLVSRESMMVNALCV